MEDPIKTIINTVKNRGIRVQAGTWQATDEFKDLYMKVIYNLNLSLKVPKDLDELRRVVKPDLPWADQHFKERISGEPTNPGESYKNWPYSIFSEENDPYKDGSVFTHTYQERFWPKEANKKERTLRFDNGSTISTGNTKGIRYEYGDLNDVIEQLKNNPLTRQAFLPIWFPEDTGAKQGRVPCTLGYLFYYMGDELQCNYYIRSCDVFRHFRNDIYLTARLLRHVARLSRSNEDPYKIGNVNMYITNLHLFENDFYPLEKREIKLYGKNK